ncbi:cation diffusion facilitator family transporter [Hyphomicrobium sp. 2TAF46]|uniref:cation diffusion facilitator family transporter n=1 Tax=Hyphomicrobium sp. 2TAF46 TaxID=3233019 RepID=UPI003F915973
MLDKIRDWLGLTVFEGATGHGHDHEDDGGHGHTHGVIDPSIATTERGIWAVKWSFVILAITSALQVLVVIATGSVALLADTIHNIADATTAIPLWIAFKLAQRKPTATFTYGYGRVEDLAGIAIVLIILFSALVAGYEAIDRIFHPQPITQLAWVALAGLVGFIGNEIVAVFRIRVGREINSAALIADGYHARTDGLTSLAVVAGAIGVWLGFPLADPIIGLLITIAIFGIVWQSAKAVLTRMLDGVDPAMIGEISHAAGHVPGIKKVLDVKARWLGHKLHSDVAILVEGKLSVTDADKIGTLLKREMFNHIPTLSVVNVRVHGSDSIADVAEAPEHTIGRHHAPEAFKVASTLARGLLAIADTSKGERMRLVLELPVVGLEATVAIDRPGGTVETLALLPVAGRSGVFESTKAPAEPHEFSAQLRLSAGQRADVVTFRMTEPAGHKH